ncbi:MAG: glycosyltransferase [Pseudomonadota bacterium]
MADDLEVAGGMLRRHNRPSKAGKARITVAFGASGRAQPASGPIQSLRALLDRLKSDFEFSFVGDQSIRPSELHPLPADTWTYEKQVRYFWFSKDGRSKARKAITRESHDSILHLNSFFDRDFTLPILWKRKFGLIPKRPIILSPHGELAPGALSFKAVRKRTYISLVRSFRLLDHVWLHATSDLEKNQIGDLDLPCQGVFVAKNCRRLLPKPDFATRRRDPHAPLRIVFLSRIDRKKNLDFALHCLRHVTVPVEFDIYGPASDAAYARQCQCLATDLPNHIRVAWKGSISHEHVPKTLASYDLFFLPTHGENFGHAIDEAFMSGLPALLSDKTPWRDLAAAAAGWDLPLGDPTSFAVKIEAMAAMDANTHLQLRIGARKLAERTYHKSRAVEDHRTMFDHVVAAGS